MLVLGVLIAEVLDIVSGTDTILYMEITWDGVLCVDYPLWCWVLCSIDQSCVQRSLFRYMLSLLYYRGI